MIAKTISYIKATPESPEVMITDDGSISLIGVSAMGNPTEFYTQIAEHISKIEARNVGFELELKLSHVNSIKPVATLIEAAKNNPFINAIRYFWIYDPNDENSYDFGKQLETILGIPCDFIEYA